MNSYEQIGRSLLTLNIALSRSLIAEGVNSPALIEKAKAAEDEARVNHKQVLANVSFIGAIPDISKEIRYEDFNLEVFNVAELGHVVARADYINAELYELDDQDRPSMREFELQQIEEYEAVLHEELQLCQMLLDALLKLSYIAALTGEFKL